MKDHVTLIYEFRRDWMIVNSVDRVMKARVAFEVLNVFDRAGGKIVDHINFVATLDVSVAQMRTDKTRATCDEYSQTELLIFWPQKSTKSTNEITNELPSTFVLFVP